MFTRTVKSALALTVVAFGSSVFAQTARFAGESLVIVDGGARIRLADVIAPHAIARSIHAVRKRDGDYFVLFSVSEFTRGYPPRGGNCGSGVESSVVWLRIADRKVVERRDALYQSCSTNREGWSMRWDGSRFVVETEDLVERERAGNEPAMWRTLKWTFDPHHPELGLKEEEIEHAQSKATTSNQAMQLTASKPAVYAWSVCRRERILRGMHGGLAAADLVSR